MHCFHQVELCYSKSFSIFPHPLIRVLVSVSILTTVYLVCLPELGPHSQHLVSIYIRALQESHIVQVHNSVCSM
jgi:hypothetical protein